MSYTEDRLLELKKQLLPEGRAFIMPVGGNYEKLTQARNELKAVAFGAAKGILFSIIPDNDNFTEQDAEQWERRLGIINGAGRTLADRKAAILQKMAYPGDVAPRCAADYIQAQLRLAGFDVYVYENIFPDGSGGYETRRPGEVSGSGFAIAMCGFPQCGQVQCGQTAGGATSKIANYIEEVKDAAFVIPLDNLRSTFFICGNPIGTIADVPLSRKSEFRQLVLNLKPAQTVGYMFINYTT